MGQFMRLFH